MINIGGWDPTSTAEFATADPWTNGIGVFDLTSLDWGTVFDTNAKPYEKSDLVTSYYASQFVSLTLSSPSRSFLNPLNPERGEIDFILGTAIFSLPRATPP